MRNLMELETRTQKVENAGPDGAINGVTTTWVAHVPNPFAQIPPTLPHLYSVVFCGSN